MSGRHQQHIKMLVSERERVQRGEQPSLSAVAEVSLVSSDLLCCGGVIDFSCGWSYPPQATVRPWWYADPEITRNLKGRGLTPDDLIRLLEFGPDVKPDDAP